MSVHLGFHWSMVLGMVKKAAGNKEISKAVSWMLRVPALSIAGYGAFCFYKADIVSYLFLEKQFAFFDFEQPAASVFWNIWQ